MRRTNLFNLLTLLWLLCGAGIVFGQTPPDTLIAKKSVWKYLDDGTDQYGAFEDKDYDDSQWQEGPGRLGYGGDGETTVLSWGPIDNNKFVTYYFRKKITINDPSAYKALLMNITRDDGIRVFVNGVEVIRDNLPAVVNYLTYAPINITGANETNYLPFYIPTGSLVAGENTIAIGLHNRDANSSDIGFDMEFLGFTEGASIQVVHNSSDITLREISLFLTTASDTLLINPNFSYLNATRFFDVALENSKLILCPAGYTQIADVIGEQSFTPAPGLKQTFFINGVVLRPNDMKAEGKVEIVRGSAWLYNDTGVDPGTNWFTSSYNDAAWKSGLTPMGYGRTAYTQGGTTISFGPSSTNKYISYYFRKTFEVEDVTEIAGALANIWFDDGFVAYINGVEVARGNMPTGNITHTTRANATVGSTAARRNFSIPLNLLTNGTNTFAITVRQDAPSSSDMTFDANLEFVFGKMLMPRGSVWKYLDDGSDQGMDWILPGFDDATWASGPAELGYGDGDEATVVAFGPDAADKYPCTYFRSSFEVSDPSTIGSMRFLAVRDDGIVVYLNGIEVFRDNMPAGNINHKTYANGTVDGNNERIFYEYEVSPDLLVSGTNTLAVSIHQDRPSSSDISFNLEIIGKEKGTFWVNPNGVALGVNLTATPSNQQNNTGVKSASFVHGVTDAPAYSLSILGAFADESLASNVVFKSARSLSMLPANAIVLKLNNFEKDWLYGVDLSGYEDSNVVFFTTGFYNLDKNEIDSQSIQATLAMVTQSGRVVLLEKPMTSFVFVNNSNDVKEIPITLTVFSEGKELMQVSVPQYSFSDFQTVPAAENLIFVVNGDTLTNRILSFNSEYLLVLQGVDNSNGDYAINQETMLSVDYQLSFYNQTTGSKWFSETQFDKWNVIAFQGITDAPFLSFSNLNENAFLSEDIAFAENTGMVALDTAFSFLRVKSNVTEETQAIFSVVAPSNQQLPFALFSKGFINPENNPEGAIKMGFWGFNAMGEKIEWSEATATLRVVHLITDSASTSLSLHIDGSHKQVAFRQISDSFTIRAFTPIAIPSLNSHVELQHGQVATLLTWNKDANIETMLLTEEDWNNANTLEALSTLSSPSALPTRFYTPTFTDISFASFEKTALNFSNENKEWVIRTSFSPADNRFFVIPSANAGTKTLLIANGFAQSSALTSFAWFGLTSSGEWYALRDTVNITLHVENIVEHNKNINIYPNPAADEVWVAIDATRVKINLYNTLGQLVVESNQTKLNTSKLPRGVYVLSVEDVDSKSIYKSKLILR